MVRLLWNRIKITLSHIFKLYICKQQVAILIKHMLMESTYFTYFGLSQWLTVDVVDSAIVSLHHVHLAV